MEKQKYYITTAITYTSGKPHIGNTYEIILADAIARYKGARATMYFFRQGQMSMVRRLSSRQRRREPPRRNL